VTVAFLELVIYMKPAKTLGFKVPEALLATADELIKYRFPNWSWWRLDFLDDAHSASGMGQNAKNSM